MIDVIFAFVQADVTTRSPGVRDALLFVLIPALHRAGLRCVRCRTRRREDGPKCGSFVLENNHSCF